MKKSYDVVASIVTYNNDIDVLNNAIRSFLDTELNVHIVISDNSPTDRLRDLLIKDTRLSYIFNDANIGFGKAHNLCIKKYTKISKYYVILNPDVYFDRTILSQLFNYLEENERVGLISPKIVYPDESIQISCRLIPTPFDMLVRRLPKGELLFKKRISQHQLEKFNYDSITEVPFLLGCFLMVRSRLLSELGGFDERFFMYMEDLDLCRRIGEKCKVVFFDKAKVYHIYERASSKSIKLFLYHFTSMVKYFNKWGWIKDKERERINRHAKSLHD